LLGGSRPWQRYAVLWLVHLAVFSVSHTFEATRHIAFVFASCAAMLLELKMIFTLRAIRRRHSAIPTTFAELGFAAAVISSAVRMSFDADGFQVAMYTDLSIRSVIAMSFQCASIILSCYYYISISLQRAEARERSVRQEAENLRLQKKLAQQHAEETQRLVDERDRMMIINSQFSTLNTLSLLGGGIVHEIVQPLQAARSALDILAMQKSARRQEVDSSIETVSRLIDQISEIIEGLRRMIRDKTVDVEDVDCDQLIRRVFPIFKSEAKRRNVHASCVIAPEMAGKYVRANPVMLERVLFNLATNALEAFEDAEPQTEAVNQRTFRVTLGEGNVRDGALAVIAFHDTGKGVTGGDYQRIFNIFGTTKSGGTGLGLYMVKAFVESWGGTIAARPSDEGPQGTTIEIKLPTLSPAPSRA
ncbi:MAG: HAMP domain-containing histidine kinase, partial [Burkholderiales bacterium]|nr:HAMP domain-containing histidine kinase [Burkholderiales bacterium]